MAENQDQRPEDEEGTQQTGPTTGGQDMADQLGSKELDKMTEAGWKPLSSSNMTAYKYDDNRKQLAIIFRGGRQYAYRGVDQETADGLGKAGSAGQYFYAHIRGNYPYSRG